MMNLLFCGNDYVFDGIVVSLLSITKRCKEELNVYLLTADFTTFKPQFTPISEKEVSVFEQIIKKENEKSKVILLDVVKFKEEILSSVNASSHYSPYSYIRLYADLFDLPNKILYLDTDVVANGDISELYKIDISDYEYAGVLDYYAHVFISRDYINTGVLLLNMEKIKSTGLFKNARELVHDKKMGFPDQTAINKLTKSKLILPEKYNSQKRLRQDTVIRHFSKTIIWFPWFHTLNIKPWNIEKLHEKYKCYEFDDILKEYLEIKNNYLKGEK